MHLCRTFKIQNIAAIVTVGEVYAKLWYASGGGPGGIVSQPGWQSRGRAGHEVGGEQGQMRTLCSREDKVWLTPKNNRTLAYPSQPPTLAMQTQWHMQWSCAHISTRRDLRRGGRSHRSCGIGCRWCQQDEAAG